MDRAERCEGVGDGGAGAMTGRGSSRAGATNVGVAGAGLMIIDGARTDGTRTEGALNDDSFGPDEMVLVMVVNVLETTCPS